MTRGGDLPMPEGFSVVF